MRITTESTFYIRAPKLNQLNILSLLAKDSHLTQAELADRCKLSVAMVNNYMKELCTLGLLEYRRKSSKSVSYHLTEAGELQVETLGGELIEEMVGLFGEAKDRIRDRILGSAPDTIRRVVLFGTGASAELVFHALDKAGVNILGICDDDPTANGRECCGRELIHPSQIRFMAPDAVIIVDPSRQREIHSNLTNLQDRGIRLICLDGAVKEAAQPASQEAVLDGTGFRPS
jgi:predicted transcriptional regulator